MQTLDPRSIFFIAAALAATAAYLMARRRQAGLLAGFAVTVLAFFFFRTSHDESYTHALFKMHEAFLSFRAGEYPYLARNILSGRALPVFLVYCPLVLALPVWLALFGIGLLLSLKIVFFLTYLAAAWGMYLLLRSYTDREAAVAGSLIYISSNYLLAELFNRFGFTELHCFVLLPYICLFLFRRSNQPHRNAVLVTIACSLLLIFHPPSFMNSAPFLLAAYAVHALLYRRETLPLAWTLMSAAAFVLATAFFWVPLWVEGRYLNFERTLPLSYKDAFLGIQTLTDHSFHKSIGPVLAVGIFLASANIFFSGRTTQHRGKSALWLAFCAACVFMFTRLSDPLWSRSEILQHSVWPHRYLIQLIFFGTLLIFNELPKKNDRLRRVLLRVLSIAAVAQGVYFMERQTTDVVFPPTEARVPAILSAYAKRPSGFAIDEFTPRIENLPVVEDTRITGSLNASLFRRKGSVESFDILPPLEGLYRLGRTWNVRYRVRAGDRPLTAFSDKRGILVAALERTDTRVSIETVKPWYVLLAGFVSAVTWSGLVFLFIAGGRSYRGVKRGLKERKKRKTARGV